MSTTTEQLADVIECVKCGCEESRYDTINGWCFACIGDLTKQVNTQHPATEQLARKLTEMISHIDETERYRLTVAFAAALDSHASAVRAETWHKAIEVAKKERVRVAERPYKHATAHAIVKALEAAATAPPALAAEGQPLTFTEANDERD